MTIQYNRPCSCYREPRKNRCRIVPINRHARTCVAIKIILRLSLCTYVHSADAEHPRVPRGLAAAFRVAVCSYLSRRTAELGGKMLVFRVMYRMMAKAHAITNLGLNSLENIIECHT